MTPDPPLLPDNLTPTAGERAVLEAFLDVQRGQLAHRVRGLSEQDARRRLVGSLTTLGGLIKHLRWVEMSWFLRRFGVDGLPPKPNSDDDEFLLTDDDTVDGLIADYEQQCQRSREEAAKHELAEVVTHPVFGDVSVRWIYVHMIEETARHAGQADVLREQIEDARSGA